MPEVFDRNLLVLDIGSFRAGDSVPFKEAINCPSRANLDARKLDLLCVEKFFAEVQQFLPVGRFERGVDRDSRALNTIKPSGERKAGKESIRI